MESLKNSRLLEKHFFAKRIENFKSAITDILNFIIVLKDLCKILASWLDLKCRGLPSTILNITFIKMILSTIAEVLNFKEIFHSIELSTHFDSSEPDKF